MGVSNGVYSVTWGRLMSPDLDTLGTRSRDAAIHIKLGVRAAGEMATTIIGVHGRKFTIDGTNRHQPESVFLAGARAFAMEFDRDQFVQAVCEEFGLTQREEIALLRTA